MENKLYRYFSNSEKLNGFTQLQMEKFKYACKKAVQENPDLGFNDLCIACRIYMNFIREFPGIDLGPIQYRE